MRVNVDKVLERGQKISELEDKSGTNKIFRYNVPQVCEFFPKMAIDMIVFILNIIQSLTLILGILTQYLVI